MSWQQSVRGFFKKLNNCNAIDKRGRKEGADAEQNEGQSSWHAVTEPVAANTELECSDSKQCNGTMFLGSLLCYSVAKIIHLLCVVFESEKKKKGSTKFNSVKCASTLKWVHGAYQLFTLLFIPRLKCLIYNFCVYFRRGQSQSLTQPVSDVCRCSQMMGVLLFFVCTVRLLRKLQENIELVRMKIKPSKSRSISIVKGKLSDHRFRAWVGGMMPPSETKSR